MTIMDKIDELKTRNANLLKNIGAWESTYKHRRPCEEYKKTGFCLHLLNAQNRKFGKESKRIFSDLASLTIR
jgi:hypothetical protein